jgi:hypothetical protein
MYETETSSRTLTPRLMSAARAARLLGPGPGVELVVPRQPSTVRRARLIAQEIGVGVEVLQISEASVHLRFTAHADDIRSDEQAIEAPASGAGPLARLGRRIGGEARGRRVQGPWASTILGFPVAPQVAAVVRRDIEVYLSSYA